MTATEAETETWEASPVELAAERAVLGSMMTPLHFTGPGGVVEVLTSPVIAEVRRVLNPEHLFEPRHQAIMRAICSLADEGRKGIDVVMVADELVRRGDLTRVGRPTYLSDLVAGVATTANAGYYADIVRAGANRRATFAYSQRVAQAATTLPEPERLPEILAGLHTELLSAVSTTAGNELPSIGNSEDLIADVLANWGRPQESSMSTGITDLDRVLNVGDGGVVVVAGRPGSGKSVLGQQVARHYAEQRGEPAIVFSAEMTRREMVERDLACLARVRLDSATGKTPLTAAEAQRLTDAAAEYQLTGTLLWYDAAPYLSVPYIRARIAEVAATTGLPKLVVIDYLQLMQLPKADRMTVAIGEVTRQLKIMAQELGLTVLLLCQLNRGPESRPNGLPGLADLRESGNIEQDADVVLLIHDVAKYVDGRGGEVDLILAKQRKGQLCTVTVSDRRPYAEFGDLTRRAPAGVTDLDRLNDDGGGESPWWLKN